MSHDHAEPSDARRMQDDLTLVSPGTTMGECLRQYWIPAALSTEVVADGDPVRLKLLGEKLIAWRDSDGVAAVMDHRCPHRNASLFLGRNENGGIRCIYHGWKFGADGTCLEQPNVPPANRYGEQVKARSYPTHERGGLIWAYLGERDVPPPLPGMEVFDLPDESVTIIPVLRECNWLQALEGDIDTSHFGYLHAGHITLDRLGDDSPIRATVANRAPDYNVRDAPWGTGYGAHRPHDPTQTNWRFANFLFPFWTQQPQGVFARHLHARAWVPLDDHHTMFFNAYWTDTGGRGGLARYADGSPIEGLDLDMEYLPNTTDWLGRWRLAANPRNDWQIDRSAQRDSRIFSGIGVVHLQDQAVTESMGPITDFENEHLGTSDRMIVRTRRRLLQAARAWRDEAVVPPGVDDPDVFRRARSGIVVAPDDTDWLDVYEHEFERAVHPVAAG